MSWIIWDHFGKIYESVSDLAEPPEYKSCRKVQPTVISHQSPIAQLKLIFRLDIQDKSAIFKTRERGWFTELVRFGDSNHKLYYLAKVQSIPNLKGYQNWIIGSKVTAIFLNGWILPNVGLQWEESAIHWGIPFFFGWKLTIYRFKISSKKLLTNRFIIALLHLPHLFKELSLAYSLYT